MSEPPTKEGQSFVSCEYFGESQDRLHYGLAFYDLPYLEGAPDGGRLYWVDCEDQDRYERVLLIDFPIISSRPNDLHPSQVTKVMCCSYSTIGMRKMWRLCSPFLLKS